MKTLKNVFNTLANKFNSLTVDQHETIAITFFFGVCVVLFYTCIINGQSFVK